MITTVGIDLTLLFELTAELAPTLQLGQGPHGARRMVPILSGTFAGPKLKGHLQPGGVDWQTARPDGVTEIEALYALETDDGAVIRVVNKGYRHGPADVMQRLANGNPVSPSEYYFRAAPVFEAPAGRYDWLNRSLFLSTGERSRTSVLLRFYEVL